MTNTVPPQVCADAVRLTKPRRSWWASMSAGLGVLSLLGVLCFHYPEWLTSRDFRAVYSETFARHLLLTGIVAAFILGTGAILRGRARNVALVGVCSAALAVLLGGATVHFGEIPQTPYSLGLDWFVISLFFSTIVFVPIERLLSVRAMSPLRPGWRTDLGYYFISHVAVQFLLIAATASGTAMDALVANEGLKQAVQTMPIWLQFVLAVFLADLAQAGLHRAYHRIPLLWRLHAVHHSSRHMDWLAGSRMHIVEVVLTRSAVLAPLVLAGFSAEAINAYVILVGLQAVLAHANLRIDFGWLEYVLVTPRYHHWHHVRDPEWVDKNYAIHLPLVDMLMGTFKRAPPGEWPAEYGVLKLETVPAGLLAQTLMPLRSMRTHRRHVGQEVGDGEPPIG